MGNTASATTRHNAQGRDGDSDDFGDLRDQQKTVRFALDGEDYVIDLPPGDAAVLRDLLSGYARKGRPTAPRRSRSAPGDVAAGSGRPSEETQRIRAWAEEHGHAVRSRGRIPRRVIEAYERR